MKDIVEFNKKNANLELPPGELCAPCLFAKKKTSLIFPKEHPGQQVLEAALKESITKTDFRQRFTSLRDRARESITRSLSDCGVDVILGPADARMASVAAAAVYPIGVMPLGFARFNGRAFGINIIARDGEEDKILHAMSAWEATFPDARCAPPLLVNRGYGD